VGIASIAGYIVLAVITRETASEFYLDASLTALLLFAFLAVSTGGFYVVLCLAAFGSCIWFTVKTWKLGHEPLVMIICGALVVLGASFYFYEPISGMTNPPMEWGYPRTVEGFFHALERGQYDKAHPTDLFTPDGWHRFGSQLGFLVQGIANAYNWVLLFVAMIPLFFIRQMQKRERAWIIFLAATYFCIGILLVIVMNPGDDRASVDLHQVFFASSHGIIAILLGYGLALIAAFMATNYERFRQWGLLGGAVAAIVALYALWETTSVYYGGPDGRLSIVDTVRWIAFAFGPNRAGLPVFGSLILVCLPLAFIGALQLYRHRAPLAVTLGIFSILPVYSGMCHWASSEQRNHWFGYWFGHDMFTPPYGIYPEMARNAVLFGGTDPGRFCPTYMIFCESFIPHKDQPVEDQKFDRRDVYIITQNALADNTYLEYIRAQYNRSAQTDPPFFQEFLRSAKEKELNYTTNFIARLAYQVLDRPFTAFGAKVEARRRAEGVYPPKEIYIPSNEDSARCFQEYYSDATQRALHDQNFPNEPKQVKQGEDVHLDNGKLSISGQTAVMSINGLLTKVIFDHNPGNEFYVEESFPLDWMYPYETPFGNIMKINRKPLEVMGEDIVKKDHEFWSKYSERMMGNWITYDTPIKQITDFAQRVYQDHDLTGFIGNRRFVRDEQAQKAFSKLRSSIAGIYDWRAFHPSGKDPAEQQRMLKEADFAYRQAFALCPYSPEAVFRYVMLLVRTQRIDDALLVARTCYEFDPKNGGVENLVHQLEDMKKGAPGNAPPSAAQMQIVLEQTEKHVHDHPDDFQAAFNLASLYVQMQQTNNAIKTLDGILNNPKVNANAILTVAKVFSQLNNYPKLETALDKLTRLNPGSPEAWYDFAAIKVFLNKPNEALPALRRAMEENAKRLAQDPKATDLAARARTDPTFNSLRALPEFKQIVK
jgi:tetratricopeptide (TPR) repeat protein